MNKTKAQELRAELQKQLDNLDDGWKVGNGSYDSASITFKVKFTESDGEEKLFTKNCYLYGFEPEDYNKTVVMGGDKLKFVGFNSRARKYPCTLLSNSGKRFKASEQSVKLALKRSES